MRFTVLFLVTFLVFVNSDLKAGQAFSHCEEAESTADSMACVKKRHDEAQERLNTAFQNIIHTQDKESMQGFHLVQNEWRSYRDKECSWEIEQVDNESLHRIEELSCIAMLTGQRAAVLEELYAQQYEKDIKEYSAFPRWMNVVSKDNPEIFWRYGDYLSIDLDCDGQEEEVMVGQKVQSHEVSLEGTISYELKTVLVVAENPVSGRPQTQLLPVNMMPSEDGGHPCDPNIEISVVDYQQYVKKQGFEKVDKEANEAKVQCVQALKLEGRWCQSSILFWDGADFKFSVIKG